MSEIARLLKEQIGSDSKAIKNALELFNEAFLYSDNAITRSKDAEERIRRPLEMALDLQVFDINITKSALYYVFKFNLSKTSGYIKNHTLRVAYNQIEDRCFHVRQVTLKVEAMNRLSRYYFFSKTRGYVRIDKYWKNEEYKGRKEVTKYFYNHEEEGEKEHK